MDEAEFREQLKKSGRSSSAADRVIEIVNEYAAYLSGIGTDLDRATPNDLESYVAWIELEAKVNAKKHLWGIRYYYQFADDVEMEKRASDLRQARITRKPFALRDFRGVKPSDIDKLEAAGIKNIEQMVKAGKTPQSRRALADKTGTPVEVILEYVKLSDIARIPGLKGIRARLYYDAGADTVEKIAVWQHEALLARLTDFVEQSGFDGIAPLPKEVQHAVETARKLPLIVDYEG
jgi:hypothetical protein